MIKYLYYHPPLSLSNNLSSIETKTSFNFNKADYKQFISSTFSTGNELLYS